MSSPRTGQVLADRYEVLAPIARGGMADVLEGRDRVLDRRVALKVFRAGAGADRARFDAEALVLAALDHPNLVRIYDAGEHDGAAFVVLELIEGRTLAEVVADDGLMAAAALAAVGADVADALAYVHEQGVVHRDVTPSNVLLDPTGRARLTDFGIARLVDTTRITAEATTVGTAAYMAPEQVQGHDVGPPADVYALGLVLLEALTGRRAFDLPAQEALVARLVRSPDTTTDVPSGWQPVLAAMTDRAAPDRPSAVEVAADLRGLSAAPAGGLAAGA
ncbi:MAG: serine/threonine-protein kinase, partial [Acidimicrobiales bacterium]